MKENLNYYIDVMDSICSFDWSALFQTLISLITLYIAWSALDSWRKQARSHRITDFLDQLTDAVHELVLSISSPVTQLEIINIGIESYKHNRDLDNNLCDPELIKFIETEGKIASQGLLDSLMACEHAAYKIKSLLTKGQVYGINDYQECKYAGELISWQYERIQAFAIIIRSEDMNWEHPAVIRNLEGAREITADSVKKYIQENQSKLLKFIKNAYEVEYK